MFAILAGFPSSVAVAQSSTQVAQDRDESRLRLVEARKALQAFAARRDAGEWPEVAEPSFLTAKAAFQRVRKAHDQGDTARLRSEFRRFRRALRGVARALETAEVEAAGVSASAWKARQRKQAARMGRHLATLLRRATKYGVVVDTASVDGAMAQVRKAFKSDRAPRRLRVLIDQLRGEIEALQQQVYDRAQQAEVSP